MSSIESTTFSYNHKDDPTQVAFGWHTIDHKNSFAILRQAIVSSSVSGIIWRDGRRKQDNFLYSDYLFLDIDDGMPIEEACRRLEDTSHIIATTKSHRIQKGNRPACDRFRVVIPFERRITRIDDYRETLTEHVRRWNADKSKVDGSSYFRASLEVVSYLSLDKDYYKADVWTGRKSKPRPEKPMPQPEESILAYLKDKELNVYRFLTLGKTFGEGRQKSIFITSRILEKIGVPYDRRKRWIRQAPISWAGFSDHEFTHAIRDQANGDGQRA